jgi:SAM-dependent methyltransferase
MAESSGVKAWEGYWRHTGEAAAHRAGGKHEPVLAQFWSTLFAGLLADRARLRILDVACGNGAALGYLFALTGGAGGSDYEISAIGLDGSVAALEDLRRRMPHVTTVAADARCIPFREKTFDVVVSQFGVEYAGADAVSGAARMVGPGGTLATVLHLRDGGIYRECARNVEAIDAVTRLVPAARNAILAGISASTGRGSRKAFQQADRALAPVVREVESILKACGKDVGGGFIFRLYNDIGHIFRNPSRFVGAEVEAWLERMSGEIAGYRGRMEGMLAAALDETQYNEMVNRVADCGMQIRNRDRLRLGEAGDAGWILVATSPAAGPTRGIGTR